MAAQIVGYDTVLRNLRGQSIPFEVGPPGAGLQNVRKHVLVTVHGLDGIEARTIASNNDSTRR
jgi:hypothetical protein